jgi:hypothetical protein
VKESIGIHGRDKAQNIFDRQADFIEIHRSVQVPGVKGAYYEDKRAGCWLADCIMLLKSKGTSRQLFDSLYQAKGTGTCYSLSFIDMYDMEAREAIHNLAAYLAHHHHSWVYKYFAAEDVKLTQTCYWHEELESMRSNKEKMWDNLMNWDTEFQAQIENMENMENMDAAPPEAAAQNFVGSVDYISFMDINAFTVSNNHRSVYAIMTPPTSTSKLFPNATRSPHMNPRNVTLARSNVYQSVSSQPTAPSIHSDMYISASTAMETFQSDIDDIKEDVQELNNGMQNIQKMLQHFITPTATINTTVRIEPSGMMSSTGGNYGPAGRY